MKIWVDDTKPAPNGYYWADTVNKVKNCIVYEEENGIKIELLDINHNLEYNRQADGGDIINLLDWLKETNRNYPIRIHGINSVKIHDIRAIIKRNGWTEIK